MDYLYEPKSFVSVSALKQNQPNYMNRNASIESYGMDYG